MDIDNMIDPVKTFSELRSDSVAEFLRGRAFKSERRSLEFGSAFPERNGKYDIREICKHIIGFSNEQGGLLFCGVSESIWAPDVPYPDYVVGLERWPTAEDLSHWAQNQIHPRIASLSLRLFVVQGRKVAILKVPRGANKPYCYYDPDSRAVWYYRRTGNGIAELGPEQIREFYVACLAEQNWAGALEGRLDAHQKLIKPKLEDIQDFGFLGMYTLPMGSVEIPWNDLNQFLWQPRRRFSSELYRSEGPEPLQDGVSVGYYPQAIRQDIKSTYRTTLYTDGMVALDSQVDSSMDGDHILHPFWLSYELQRHLQLSRAVLESWQVERAHLIIELGNIEHFCMAFDWGPRGLRSPYSGSHQRIKREVSLSEIYPYDGDKRNVVMPLVKDIMDEVCRIFGYPETPPGLWDEKGYLTYVKGAEYVR